MTEDEITRLLTDMPGVALLVASEENGAPEAAWGDSFFFYDPDDVEENRRFPFATIVIQDYAGFDVFSKLDRPGVYRLNLNVGRDPFRALFGFPPSGFAEHQSEFDYTVLDQVLPHPVYGQQAWVSVVVPGGRTDEQVRGLLVQAYDRARSHHRGASPTT